MLFSIPRVSVSGAALMLCVNLGAFSCSGQATNSAHRDLDGSGASSTAPLIDAGSDALTDASGAASGEQDANVNDRTDASAVDGGISEPPDAGEPTCQRSVLLASSTELAAAINDAAAGDCIVLADGEYAFPTITKIANAQAPIVIRAQNRGKAEVSSGSIIVKDSAYIVLEGLNFTASGNIQITESTACRVTRCRIHPAEKADLDWLIVEGAKSHHTRIDHNDFGPKQVVSNMIMLEGDLPDKLQVVQYTHIHHNYFHDIKFGGGNNWEAIRVGRSWLAPSKAFSVIEFNLFKNTGGDPEVLSVKSSDNTVRYNTMRSSPGQFTLRHGNRNKVYGNYILGEGKAGAGGIRVYGADHLIYNNYIANTNPGIMLGAGSADGTEERGAEHYRVYRAQVVNNTLIGTAIQFGGGLAPLGCTIANNLFQGGGVQNGGTMTKSVGNISGDTGMVMSEGIWKLAKGSRALDAASPGFDFVVDDIDGQARNQPDVGADELSTEAPGIHGPLTEKDVGPDAP